MRKFTPTKALKTPSETLRNAYKNHQKHAISKKTRSHRFLTVFHTSYAPKLEKLSVLFSFFGGGIVLMAMMASLKTVCASPCRWGCTTCFVAIWSRFFRDPAQCRANQVHDQFLERPKHLWISVQKSRTLGSATNSWFFEGLGPQV